MRRRRLLLILPAVWFIALLSAPAVAWVAGKRQPLLEQRRKIEFPPINRSSLQSAEVFKKIDAAILDRLPFRGDALQLKARIALRAFGVSPNLEVVAGNGGWLYMWRDFRPCMDAGDGADVADAVDVIARTTGASGRRVGVVVAGSKTATQPEHLRNANDQQLAVCVAEHEEHVHARLRATPGGIDFTADLKRELAAGRNVFLKKDSHWEGNAQRIFVEKMLDAAQPGLAKEVGLSQVKRPVRREADLTAMVGMAEDQDTWLPIATKPKQYPDARPAETLLIGDSQLRLAMTDTVPGRPSVADAALPGPYYCERSGFPNGACDAQLAGARTVLFEWVARDMQDITGACLKFPEVLLPDLRKRLPARAVSLVGVADGKRARSELRFGAQPQLLRFAPAGGDVSTSLRLMVVPVERIGTPQPGGPTQLTVTQRPTDGKPVVPCTAPTLGAGGTLIVPIPAGRSAAAIGLELAAPPGSVLGKATAFVLDDATVRRGLEDGLQR